jgi:hypothetical protein
MEGPADVSVHVGKLKNWDVSVIAENEGMTASLNLGIPISKFVKQLQYLNRILLGKIADDLQGMRLVLRNRINRRTDAALETAIDEIL